MSGSFYGGDGGLTSPVAVADGGTGSTTAAEGRAALGIGGCLIDLWSILTLSSSIAIPATLSELQKSPTANARRRISLAGYGKIAIQMSAGVSTIDAGSLISIQYSTDDGSTWRWLDTGADASADTAIGSHEPKITPVSNGIAYSSELTLPSALGTVQVRPVASGGGGVNGPRGVNLSIRLAV